MAQVYEVIFKLVDTGRIRVSASSGEAAREAIRKLSKADLENYITTVDPEIKDVVSVGPITGLKADYDSDK